LEQEAAAKLHEHCGKVHIGPFEREIHVDNLFWISKQAIKITSNRYVNLARKFKSPFKLFKLYLVDEAKVSRVGRVYHDQQTAVPRRAGQLEISCFLWKGASDQRSCQLSVQVFSCSDTRGPAARRSGQLEQFSVEWNVHLNGPLGWYY
jgi:hypothetical protein